jgi:hypothetical protein
LMDSGWREQVRKTRDSTLFDQNKIIIAKCNITVSRMP